MWLRLDDIPELGVVFPTSPDRPPLIAFLLALPMGWVELPPYFTVLTETACDLTNAQLRDRGNDSVSTAHRLESVAATQPAAQVSAVSDISPPAAGKPVSRPAPASAATGCLPVAAVDVSVDDFLLMAQTENLRQSVLRSALESIDVVQHVSSPSLTARLHAALALYPEDLSYAAHTSPCVRRRRREPWPSCVPASIANVCA